MATQAKNVIQISRSRKQKERDILTSAAKIFVRDGFEKAHMDEIANKANVSKQTIYSNFGSKENLFNEIVSDIFKELQKEPLYTNENNYGKSPQEILQTFLEKMMMPMFSKKSVALYRLAICEGPNNKKLSQIFISRIERGVTRLATVLEKLEHLGHITVEDSHEAAHNLIYQCKGIMHSKLLCGFQTNITKDEIIFLAQKHAEDFIKLHKSTKK